ncbi:bifunctional DNA primase/polymerase [Salinarimonas soli]|nr:bifunctional DNA primase/polymerase [Salinarimonas soli]
MLALALHNAAQGFYVFPCVPEGKLPAIKAWQERATRDPARIRAWWTERDPVLQVTREHAYNVGIRMGRFGDDGWCVALDVDIKAGAKGRESLEALDMNHGEPGWLDTFTVDTPSGGVHYYFTTAEPMATSASKLGPGLDTRGEGGYVLAPGSVVQSRPYVARGGTLRGAPPWLRDMIGTPAPRTRPEANGDAVLDLQPALDRAARFLSQEAPKGVPEGQRGSTAYRVAARIKDFGVSELACVELMAEEWADTCEPPMPFEDLAESVAHAYEYGQRPIGVDDPANDFDPVEDEDLVAPKPKPLPFTRPALLAYRNPPPREWLVEGLIPRKKTTLLMGDGGVGKSLLALQLATAVDLGKTFLGRPARRGKVLALFSEDDTDELHRRQQDVCAAAGAGLDDLAGSYWWTADDLKDGAHLMVMTASHPGGQPTALLAKLLRAIDQIRPELVILDHAANIFAGQPNSGPEVTSFVNRVPNRICVEFGATVVMLAHPSLRGITDGSGEAGSRAWNNAVRSRLYLTRPPNERSTSRRILQVKKANYGPLGEEVHLEWRRGAFHVSTPDGYEGEDVPEELRGQILNAIQAAWDAGDPWSRAAQAGKRAAPSRIHSQFGVPLTIARSLIESWIEAGTVVSEVFDKRNERTGLRVVSAVA